ARLVDLVRGLEQPLAADQRSRHAAEPRDDPATRRTVRLRRRAAVCPWVAGAARRPRLHGAPVPLPPTRAGPPGLRPRRHGGVRCHQSVRASSLLVLRHLHARLARLHPAGTAGGPALASAPAAALAARVYVLDRRGGNLFQWRRPGRPAGGALPASATFRRTRSPGEDRLALALVAAAAGAAAWHRAVSGRQPAADCKGDPPRRTL